MKTQNEKIKIEITPSDHGAIKAIIEMAIARAKADHDYSTDYINHLVEINDRFEDAFWDGVFAELDMN